MARRCYSYTFVIAVEGEVVGMLQHHEETDPVYRSAGIDIAVSPPYHGRGLGTDAIRTIARFLFDVRGHHRLTIDPACENVRAQQPTGRSAAGQSE